MPTPKALSHKRTVPPRPVSHRASRSEFRSELSVPWILIRIRSCESGKFHNGAPSDVDYTAQNQWSTASGAYQFLDSTWHDFHGYSRAMYAPAWVQDLYAIKEYNQDGTWPWAASRGCWD